MTSEDGLFGLRGRPGAANALVGWALTVVVAFASLSQFVSGRTLWGGFWLFALGLLALPAVLRRDWTVFVPWPLPASAVAAIALQTTGQYTGVAGYVAIATVSLVAVIELDRFTSVEMSRRFTVGFGVLTTMAVQAVWSVVQFLSDQMLGTEFIPSQTELQWDIVFVTLVALLMGGLFVGYFDRFAPVESGDRPVTPEEAS
jgi:hypothetical protein